MVIKEDADDFWEVLLVKHVKCFYIITCGITQCSIYHKNNVVCTLHCSTNQGKRMLLIEEKWLLMLVYYKLVLHNAFKLFIIKVKSGSSSGSWF